MRKETRMLNIKNKGFFERDRNKAKPQWDFFNEEGGKSLNKNNFPVPFFEIIALFAKDCDNNLRKCWSDGTNLYIRGDDYQGLSYCELMLEYGELHSSLEITRVRFIKRKKSKMKELYRILRQIQKMYKIDTIIFEADVITDDLKPWFEENGMGIGTYSKKYIADKNW